MLITTVGSASTSPVRVLANARAPRRASSRKHPRPRSMTCKLPAEPLGQP